MPAYYLESLTIALGLVLLLLECLVPAKSKSWLGLIAAAGLLAIIALLPLAIGPDSAKPDSTWGSWPLWNFY